MAAVSGPLKVAGRYLDEHLMVRFLGTHGARFDQSTSKRPEVSDVQLFASSQSTQILNCGSLVEMCSGRAKGLRHG
jgi:hypothetical protein